MTPLQLANLFATIGNEGSLWRPYLVKRVINTIGETVMLQEPELVRRIDKIKSESFRLVKEGLMAVVMDKEGTGKNAAVPGVTVAGKTGANTHYLPHFRQPTILKSPSPWSVNMTKYLVADAPPHRSLVRLSLHFGS